MNLQVVKAVLENYFDKKQIDLEFEMTDKKLTVSGNLNFGAIDAAGYCSFAFFTSGMAVYSVLFDEIDKTPEALGLINKFNIESLLLKATADDYLTLDYTVYKLHEADIEEYTNGIFDDLTCEDAVNFLKPIIALTY